MASPSIQPKTKAKVGDNIEWEGNNYLLAVRQGNPKVFYDGRYVDLDWTHIQKHPTKPGWLHSDVPVPQLPGPHVDQLQTFTVAINIGSERIVYELKSRSPGMARNSAIGKLALKMGLDIKALIARLHSGTNSITVSK